MNLPFFVQYKYKKCIQKLVKHGLFIILICFSLSEAPAQSGCIENVTLHSVPVQCNSFRNGSIVIDTVIGGTPPFYFSIDGTTFSTRPVFDFLWPGYYTVWVRDSLGCEHTTSIEVTEPPVLTVSLTASDELVAIGDWINLYATISPANASINSISWRPPLLFDDNNSLFQSVSISETTVIAVDIVDKNGCTARDQVLIEVEKPNIFIPNVILVGSNTDAYFTVFTDENIKKINLLRVYGRDGSLVFERQDFAPNDPLLGWNGRYDGRKVQPGVFTWLVLVQYPDGRVIQKTGTLTVLR